MPQLIKNNEFVEDNWSIVEKDAEFPTEAIASGENVVLPLSLWQTHQNDVLGKSNVGLWLDSDESPESIAEHCNTIPIIAINFPAFADGRGYSYARQLREYFNFEGELRAIGDVLQDQLFFYKRCGFNTFALRKDQADENAINSLNDFTVFYQSANDKIVPAFKKR